MDTIATTYDYSSLFSSNTTTSVPSVDLGGSAIWAIVAIVLSIIGGILVYFLFVKSKNTPKGKFLKGLKDFLAFKTMWLEAITKVFYYIATIFAILFSFALISTSFIAFLVMLIVVPIIIRLAYESVIMFIMIWRNTADIAKATSEDGKKLKK